MHAVHPMLVTLVAALSLALLLGLLARQLRLPPLVGYLLAGVLVGPYTPGFVADQQVTSGLAEVGVALLLFGVGLHFSLADLLAVRRLVVPGALGQVAAGILLGGLVGAGLLGLAPGPAAVFGLALAIASTTVATRALADRSRLNSEAGRIALGWLVVQDLVVVLALVLLPAAGGGGSGSGTGTGLALSVLRAVAELAAFLGLMVLVGRRLLPWALGRAARTGSRELFTLAVVVAALGVALAAALLFNVSLALGAFLAGVVLGESHLSHQAASRALPLEQIFAVLFFVSVGMLFDPVAVMGAPLAAAAAVVATLLGTGLATFGLLLALGVELRTAVTVGAALAQIGEFSFVVVELAVGRGLLPPEVRGVVLLAAFATIVGNPLLAWAAEGQVARIIRNRNLPRWLRGRPGRHGVPQEAAGLEGHAIIVGHGRVGSIVTAALRLHGLPFVVVDDDHKRCEALRAQGTPAIWGDATEPEVLAATFPEKARLLVVALPVAFQAQRVLHLARAANPAIEVAVRAHNDEEVSFLMDHAGVGLVVMGEREVALGTSDFVLQRLGVDAAAAQATIDALRAGLPGTRMPA